MTIRQIVIDYIVAWLEVAPLSDIEKVFDQDIINEGARAKARKRRAKAPVIRDIPTGDFMTSLVPEERPIRPIIRRPRVLKHPRRKVEASDRDRIISGLKGLKLNSKEYKETVNRLCKELGLSRRQVAMTYRYRNGVPGAKKKFKVEKVIQ